MINDIYDFFCKRRQVFFAGVAALVLGMAVLVFFQGGIGTPKRTDVTVFVRAAQAVIDGENLYDVKTIRQWNYVYLPLFAVLIVPFAKLPFCFLVMVWYGVSIAMAAGVLLLSSAILVQKSRRYRSAILAFLLCLPVMLHTLARGQLGVFSLFFALLVFYLYQRGRWVETGIWLGFAVVIKVSPLLFLFLFFAAKRQWKVCVTGVFSLVFFIFVAPALVLGISRNLQLLRFWVETMTLAVSPHAASSPLWAQLVDPYAEDNQSIFAVLIRLFLPAASNFEMHSSLIRLMARGIGMLLLTAAGALTFRSGSGKKSVEEFTDYAFFPMIMLLAAPVSEAHHYTVIFMPIMAALAWIQSESMTVLGGRVFGFAAGLASALLFGGLVYAPLNFDGAFVWASLLLCGTLFYCRLCGRSLINTTERQGELNAR